LRKLEQLKKEVRSCGRPVRDYPCEWTGSGFAYMEEFGRRVLDDLWSGVLCNKRYVSKEVWRHVLDTDLYTDPRYIDECQPVPRSFGKILLPLPGPRRCRRRTRSAKRWMRLPPRSCGGSMAARAICSNRQGVFRATSTRYHTLHMVSPVV
jgi:hypothetical protein